MKKFPFVSLCLFAGSIFDLRGTIAKGIREYTILRSRPQPKNVQEAFLMDMKAIGGDMRKAMDKWPQAL